jgi:hypothetical protein
MPNPPPALPQLVLYAPPQPEHLYVIGADPAEGNPQSDDSALCVIEVGTGEEVATLAGRFEPATFAAHIDAVAQWYNGAYLMVERNNHGHAVLLWLRDNTGLSSRLLKGLDGNPGWNTTTKAKAMLYDQAGERLRDGDAGISSTETFTQLTSIEGSTLRAPRGQMDDRAVAFVLAIVGRFYVQDYVRRQSTEIIAYPQAADLAALDDSEFTTIDGTRIRFDDDNRWWVR